MKYTEAIPIKNNNFQIYYPFVHNFFFIPHGLPYLVQSDQGAYFTSKVLKQVISFLRMLIKFCLKSGKDCDEGLSLMLYDFRGN